ncbi:MAG: MBL fold metallo-hydrolase [Lachnospiraceae bacterium]|nr:MBL fold metallo-hydrolase [Lachnospiraceae bacterium]
MEIKRLELGMLRTNGYIAYCEETKKAVVIDAAAEPEKIKNALCELNLTPEAVLLTHGHFDHILAADMLRKEYHIPVGLLSTEADLLADPKKNCSATFFGAPYGISADELFADGQILPYLDGRFRVIATPGHTEGSCCYYAGNEGVLFSGDTLFAGSVGRTDLPTGRAAALGISIKERLFSLPEETLVLPGHSEETTIGEEKRHNPYVM